MTTKKPPVLDLGSITPEQLSRDASFLRAGYPDEYEGLADKTVFGAGMMQLSRIEGRPVMATIGGELRMVSVPSRAQEDQEWADMLRSLPATNPRAGTNVDVYPVQIGSINDMKIILD